MLRGTVHVATATAFISTLLLSGCASDPTPAPAAPAPSTSAAAPVFATKEEAVAAAEKVYRRYLAIGESLRLDPESADLTRFSKIVTTDQMSREESSFDRLKEDGLRAEGPLLLKVFQPQRVELRSGVVRAYVCLDYSEAVIIQSDGTRRHAAQTTSTVLAEFVSQEGRLLFDGQTPYGGKALC